MNENIGLEPSIMAVGLCPSCLGVKAELHPRTSRQSIGGPHREVNGNRKSDLQPPCCEQHLSKSGPISQLSPGRLFQIAFFHCDWVETPYNSLICLYVSTAENILHRQTQAWANYGPEAICGPLSFQSWPAKLKEITDR